LLWSLVSPPALPAALGPQPSLYLLLALHHRPPHLNSISSLKLQFSNSITFRLPDTPPNSPATPPFLHSLYKASSHRHPGLPLARPSGSARTSCQHISHTMKKSLPFTFTRSDFVPRMIVSYRLPRSLPPLRQFVPHKIRRKWRATKSRINSGVSPSSTLTVLQTSFSPADTINALRQHQWSAYDAQYLLLALVAIFCLCIVEIPGPMVKTGIATLLMISLILPITRQFFLPSLPIFGWLVLFYSCK